MHLSSACLDILHKVNNTIKNGTQITGYARDGLNWVQRMDVGPWFSQKCAERELSSVRLQSALGYSTVRDQAGACLILSARIG